MVNGGYLICMIILNLGICSSVLLVITLHGLQPRRPLTISVFTAANTIHFQA